METGLRSTSPTPLSDVSVKQLDRRTPPSWPLAKIDFGAVLAPSCPTKAGFLRPKPHWGHQKTAFLSAIPHFSKFADVQLRGLLENSIPKGFGDSGIRCLACAPPKARRCLVDATTMTSCQVSVRSRRVHRAQPSTAKPDARGAGLRMSLRATIMASRYLLNCRRPTGLCCGAKRRFSRRMSSVDQNAKSSIMSPWSCIICCTKERTDGHENHASQRPSAQDERSTG